MSRYPFSRAVTLVNRTKAGSDPYGNDLFSDVELTVTDCAVWPGFSVSVARTSDEQIGDRSTVITGLTVMMPAGTVVRSFDRVRVNGRLFDVDGEPSEWISPYTNTSSGVQVILRAVEG